MFLLKKHLMHIINTLMDSRQCIISIEIAKKILDNPTKKDYTTTQLNMQVIIMRI